MASLPEIPDLIVASPILQAEMHVEPDTTVFGANGEIWAEHYLQLPLQLLRFPGLADFLVPISGGSVKAMPSMDSNERTVRMLWATQVVPLLRTRHAGVVLHGCAVEVDQMAVAFLGASGAGKSTLTASFAASGSPLISDDILWVQCEGRLANVQPSEPTIRLWHDSEEALSVATDTNRLPSVSYTTKAQFKLGHRLAYCPEPRPLSAIFVLLRNEVDAPVITTREKGAALTDLVQHSFLLDRNQTVARRAHFDSLATLADIAPIFSFDFPRRYDVLASARSVIIGHLGSLNASFAMSDQR